MGPGPCHRALPAHKAAHSPAGTGFGKAGRYVITSLAVLVLIKAPVQVQATPVCSNTPASGERIECTEGETSTTAIDIDAVDIDIDTSNDGEPGIKAEHGGEADIEIDVSATDANDPATIDTTGNGNNGVYGTHTGTGKNSISVSDASITTQGVLTPAIYAKHSGSGDVDIDVWDTIIETAGQNAHGINGTHTGEGAGDIHIDVWDTIIETAGKFGYGIYSTSEGDTEPHDQNITTRRNTITTMADDTYGIWARNQTASDNITIDGEDDSITTNGLNAHGIYGYHAGEGDILMDLRDLAITTNSTALHTTYGDTFSQGVYARHAGTGDIDIDIQGGTVDTKGAYSYGVYGILEEDTNGGTLSITTGGNNTITTTGDSGHGIVAYHYGTPQDSSLTSIDVGGSINVSGAGAQGVRVGISNADGEPERVAAIGTDGYRRQTVLVNGPIMSAAEGVFLAGGGKVVIGPQGSIDSASGIAILATGTVPEVPEDTTDPNNVIPAIPAIPPKLRVDLNLGGRQVSEAIGDDWILNDGGETTLAVNNVVLHDGATGNTGNTAPNGVWDVTLASPGVKVTDRMDPDPANWTTEASTTPADRDFSAADFSEAEVRCQAGLIGTPPDCRTPPPPPPPPPPPSTQTVTPPPPSTQTETPPPPSPESGSEPASQSGSAPGSEPERLTIVEKYAPRAALYEALPDFLLRMQRWESASPRLFVPESPVWIRLLGSTGSQEFKRSTVGVDYDADRLAVEAGVTISVSETFDLTASLHHVTGSAEVDSPTMGGDIHVKGKGVSLDTLWSLWNDTYASAHLSLTEYDLALSSDTIGRLKSSVDASGQALRVEVGRRMQRGERLHWTPRVWLERSRISVDGFTDAVHARVSFSDRDRTTGGLGVLLQTVGAANGGELVLNGSLDFEQKLGGSKTLTRVSGERLTAEAEQSSILLGLGGVWHRGFLQYSAGLSAREELDSGGEEYSGFIRVGMGF